MAVSKKTSKVTGAPEEVLLTENVSTEIVETAAEVKVAKAGKRSAKSLEVAEAKLEKEERKASKTKDESEDKPKAQLKPHVLV